MVIFHDVIINPKKVVTACVKAEKHLHRDRDEIVCYVCVDINGIEIYREYCTLNEHIKREQDLRNELFNLLKKEKQ